MKILIFSSKIFRKFTWIDIKKQKQRIIQEENERICKAAVLLNTNVELFTVEKKGRLDILAFRL